MEHCFIAFFCTNNARPETFLVLIYEFYPQSLELLLEV
jgi:hypothetical protein